MSHLVRVKTRVRNAAAVHAACRRLELTEPRYETVLFFDGTAHGLSIQLKGWRYQVVCDLLSGEIHYDNYEGQWGDQYRLNEFLHAYAIEAVKLTAAQQGKTCIEQPLADGRTKLTIHVEGAAACP